MEGWRQQSQQWAIWGPGSRTERLQQDPQEALWQAQEPSNLREELEAPRRWERQSARLSEELSEVRRRADEAKAELEKAKAGHMESEAAKVHLAGIFGLTSACSDWLWLDSRFGFLPAAAAVAGSPPRRG